MNCAYPIFARQCCEIPREARQYMDVVKSMTKASVISCLFVRFSYYSYKEPTNDSGWLERQNMSNMQMEHENAHKVGTDYYCGGVEKEEILELGKG